ncbi:MAG: glutamine--tRNA ligase/YqeY domain fusion protein [Bacteroidetes bacterium]|nr:glutamine--tRNA ligase/YqeY domain fusion protein [Bacteroidota bacterium]
MDESKRALNFIEHIIEEDLKTPLYTNEKLRFRFPPEPNGYLHIGHASSICLNFGLGKRYGAPVNLRFDDTNPSKEEQEYVDAIKADVKWLGFNWDEERYASDYFEQLYLWAEMLIEKGAAYIDSQTADQIAEQKGTPTTPGVASPYRNRSVAENLELFRAMRDGQYPEGTHVLRAKIDMSSSNMLMRDPILYRIMHKHHHRTANDWCIYPMYDWAHGQSDYIEQVSHSLCTLEFAMHRELYDWCLDQIIDSEQLRPKQREFARRNFSHTVVSKRKLLQLVNQGHVQGWDDPRMPTLSGMRKRGYPPLAIHKFADTIGIAKRENVVDLSVLEHHVREELNRTAPRVMVVLDPVKVVITNYPESETEWLTAENNPEDETAGFRKVPFSREIYIERADFKEEANRKFFRLKIGGEVRLKNAYIINATSCVKDDNGEITEIHCTYDPKSLSGSGTPESERKVKGTLHWVACDTAITSEVRLYDRLFTDPTPDAHKDKDFLEFLNPNSLETITAYAEPALNEANPGDQFQFQRMGYFVLDHKQGDRLVFNRTVGLKDSWAKIETID